MNNNHPAFAKSTFEKVRMPVQRILGVALFVLLAVADSAWEDHGRVVGAVVFASGCVLAAVGSLGRLWCSLYIAGYKNATLITCGPYSICRNPLYFFSLVGFVGVGLASEMLSVALLLLATFAVYYPAIIRAEERRLAQLHGDAYADYVCRVPRLWPRLALLREPAEYLTQPVVFRRHMLSAMWFVWLIGILEIIEELHELRIVPVLLTLF